MKAIQIKYMGCTDTKPSRLKAMVEGMDASYIEDIDHGMDITEQALRMAQRVILNQHWEVVITGSGMLPNGDWVFTIGGK
jgi:hypothetical protein